MSRRCKFDRGYRSGGRRSSRWALVLLALALAIGLALRAWIRDDSAQAEQASPAQAAVGETLRQENTSDGSEATGSAASTGITVQASNFRIEGDRFLADVCFDLPDDGDWTIRNATLRYGETEIIGLRDGFGFSQIDVVIPGTEGTKGQRCDTIHFTLPQPYESGLVTLTIHAIAAMPREGEACDPAFLARAQEVLDAQSTRIRVGCVQEQLASGGMVEGLTVLEKPEDMSLEEAQALIGSQDFLIDVRGFRGNWTFTATPRR